MSLLKIMHIAYKITIKIVINQIFPQIFNKESDLRLCFTIKKAEKPSDIFGYSE